MANVSRLGGYGDTSGGGLMFRNKVINGGFDIWQRGTSQTSSGYGSDDRWSNLNNGSTKTTSQQTFTLGQTEVPGNPRYWSRTVVTSSAGAGNYVYKLQPVENVATLSGQLATLSFWAKADASKNIAIEFVQNFGTGGSPSAAITGIGAVLIALTSTWKYFTVTVSMPSITGKTLGTNNDHYLGLNFWFDAGSTFNSRTNSLGQQSGTFDIANVQLEAGDQPTPFEQRPIGVELMICQRYYCIVSSCSLIASTTDAAVGTIQYPVTMRIAPALDLTGPAQISDTQADKTQSSKTIAVTGSTRINNQSANITLANFTGLTVVRPQYLISTGAQITCSSEL